MMSPSSERYIFIFYTIANFKFKSLLQVKQNYISAARVPRVIFQHHAFEYLLNSVFIIVKIVEVVDDRLRLSTNREESPLQLKDDC